MSAEPLNRSESSPSLEPGAVGRPALDRRAFLGGVGVAAGAALAASILPIAAAHAASLEAPAAVPTHGTGAADSVSAAQGPGPDDAWDIDDMWGHWPRYAHPIPYARVQPAAAAWEQIDPVDRRLVT